GACLDERPAVADDARPAGARSGWPAPREVAAAALVHASHPASVTAAELVAASVWRPRAAPKAPARAAAPRPGVARSCQDAAVSSPQDAAWWHLGAAYCCRDAARSYLDAVSFRRSAAGSRPGGARCPRAELESRPVGGARRNHAAVAGAVSLAHWCPPRGGAGASTAR